jgi:hypothetical protein
MSIKYDCGECGATVDEEWTDVHADWHEKHDRLHEEILNMPKEIAREVASQRRTQL